MSRRDGSGRGGAGVPSAGPSTPGSPAPTGWANHLEEVRTQLLEIPVDELDDQARLELLHSLELLTRTVGAVAARAQVAFHASQVAAQLQDGVAPSRAGRGVPDDLAVARMTSPYWGSRDLTSAKALVLQMPRTLAALSDGRISPLQARLITETTACLDPGDRASLDTRLADRLEGASTAEITAAARALVYEVDPAGYVQRARKAAEDRGVSIRPLSDVMGLLSARLPAAQAIACYQSLREHALALTASGDPRTLAQLMADLLYSRLTGREIIDGIDIELGLVITDTALFTGTNQAAHLDGHGPIPATLARDMLRPTGDEIGNTEGDDAPAALPPPAPAAPPSATPVTPTGPCPEGPRCTSASCTLLHGTPTTAPTVPGPGSAANTPPVVPEPAAPESEYGPPTTAADTVSSTPAGLRAARVWLRRLYTDPVTGALTRRDTRKRLFAGSLRAFLIARDRTCRNAWCGAPIRHIDHITPHSQTGLTDEDNGRGLCAHCNLTREHPRHLHRPATSYRPPPPLLPTFFTVAEPQGP